MDQYIIYLVNQSASTKDFWCFLTQPEALNNENVFANSSVNIAIDPGYKGYDTFTIPVQYSLGAGGSNEAVGLDIKVDAQMQKKVSLGEGLRADYANAPPNKGPNLGPGSAVGSDSVGLQVNNFNQVANEEHGWFSNASFGIETAQGFIGMTWSPSPGENTTITPKLTFYVATGNFGINTLASFGTVSSQAAQITLDDFDRKKATVTLMPDGTFKVVPGMPPFLLPDDADDARLDAAVEVRDGIAMS